MKSSHRIVSSKWLGVLAGTVTVTNLASSALAQSTPIASQEIPSPAQTLQAPALEYQTLESQTVDNQEPSQPNLDNQDLDSQNPNNQDLDNQQSGNRDFNSQDVKNLNPEGLQSTEVLESATHTQAVPASEPSEIDIQFSVGQASTDSPLVADNTVEILNPLPETVLDTPATTVIVRYPASITVELRVNDIPVSQDLIGRTESDPNTGMVTQTWYGVALEAGDNMLSIFSSGETQPWQSIPVAVRGVPTDLILRSQEPHIPADGRSTTTIQGQLLDDNGNLSNWNAVVTLSASAGEFVGNDYAPDQPGFQVQAQSGTFSAQLQADLEAQTVQLRATTNGLSAYNQVQFQTPQRPSIATGTVDLRFGARGTDFYESFRDFLPLDENNRYQVDVDAAVFTTGSIGEWLFTGAYNSERALNEDCRGEVTLFRHSGETCANNYPTYGDDSERSVLTPSIDSVFLRLERTSPHEGAGVDYAMWGDFDTEEFAQASQLFSATSRQLHGFKLNYNFGDLALSGFYGDNIEGFQRDTLAPDGTSGYYFLSQRQLVAGSEEIFLEVEELDRPGTVLERQRLYRGTDYEIDYDRGSILFNDPVLRTGVNDVGDILVRRIVATYQFDGGTSSTGILAGRLQYNLARTLNQESWVGTSYVQENQGNRRYELMGADAQISLGEDAQLTAEWAHSANDFELSGPVSGSAYRVALEGAVNEWFSGSAFWSSTDEGFTNRATTSFRPGQTRYGAEANAQLSDSTTVRAQFDHEDNFGTAPRPLVSLSDLLSPGLSPVPGSRVDNSLTTFSVGLSQRLGSSLLEFDWIHRDRASADLSVRNDAINPGTFNTTSDQLRTRLVSPLSDTVTITAQNDLNLSGSSDPLYPSRTLIGLDWQVMPGITLGANQIFFGGGGINGRNSITTVDLSGEHTFGEDTTVRGRFSSIEGQQLGGAVGLEQGFTLAPGLRLDLAYEHVFNNLYSSTAAGTQFYQPYAVGTGGSGITLTSGDSYAVGLSYTDNADFQASTRLEHRSSSQGSNTVFEASALGRLTPSISLLLDYELANTANQSIPDLGATSHFKLGLAYRNPDNDAFNALLRYEHRLNPNTLPTNALFGTSLDTAEHLFSAEAIYAPNWQWEFYAKYAFRNSSTSYTLPADVGGSFNSSNSMHLAQMRATYRFNYYWDVTGEARWLGGLGSYNETGFALEAGYYPTPDLRIYAGFSGGGANDRDFGVNRSAGGFYLGISAKINELLNGFGLQEVAPAQQQESVTTSSGDELERNEPVTSEPANSIVTPASSSAAQ
jgi:Invasin, domain 3